MLETNLLAPCMLTYTFLKKLESRKSRSALINVASIAGVSPMPKFSIYCSTKVYLRYLTNALGEESLRNIDILLLSPGFVTTKMTLYKTGFDACTPETTAKNTFRNLGYDKETNGFWVHEVSHLLLQVVYRFFPSFYYLTVTKIAHQTLVDKYAKAKEQTSH
mmetsp:Transcript_41253/g.47525  ORF Transcript_41253/g.47525 Transcript_41253/m.47525 type:complete len:162 (-) Transcript_41253:143-628(-)